MNWYLKQLYKQSSRKLPNIGYRELSKFLNSLGFQYVSTKGDHQKWKNHQTGQTLTILDPSSWGSNSKNILEYILKDLGIFPKDFAKLWNNKSFRKDPTTHIDVSKYNPGNDYQNLMRDDPISSNQQNINQQSQNLEPNPDDPNDWRQYLKYKPNK